MKKLAFLLLCIIMLFCVPCAQTENPYDDDLPWGMSWHFAKEDFEKNYSVLTQYWDGCQNLPLGNMQLYEEENYRKRYVSMPTPNIVAMLLCEDTTDRVVWFGLGVDLTSLSEQDDLSQVMNDIASLYKRAIYSCDSSLSLDEVQQIWNRLCPEEAIGNIGSEITFNVNDSKYQFTRSENSLLFLLLNAHQYDTFEEFWAYRETTLATQNESDDVLTSDSTTSSSLAYNELTDDMIAKVITYSQVIVEEYVHDADFPARFDDYMVVRTFDRYKIEGTVNGVRYWCILEWDYIEDEYFDAISLQIGDIELF